jgi:hypothetical protein
VSDAKPPSMTCDCLESIVLGPASTIEDLDARPLSILSRPQTREASGSRRLCRISISLNARSLPDFPKFAQAVTYGVPGTKQIRMLSPELLSPELRAEGNEGALTRVVSFLGHGSFTSGNT